MSALIFATAFAAGTGSIETGGLGTGTIEMSTIGTGAIGTFAVEVGAIIARLR